MIMHKPSILTCSLLHSLPETQSFYKLYCTVMYRNVWEEYWVRWPAIADSECIHIRVECILTHFSKWNVNTTAHISMYFRGRTASLAVIEQSPQLQVKEQEVKSNKNQTNVTMFIGQTFTFQIVLDPIFEQFFSCSSDNLVLLKRG